MELLEDNALEVSFGRYIKPIWMLGGAISAEKEDISQGSVHQRGAFKICRVSCAANEDISERHATIGSGDKPSERHCNGDSSRSCMEAVGTLVVASFSA